MSAETRSEIAKLWDAYPTIEAHPLFPGVRLARHPNGPVIVDEERATIASPAGYIGMLFDMYEEDNAKESEEDGDEHVALSDLQKQSIAQTAEWIALACYRALGG